MKLVRHKFLEVIGIERTQIAENFGASSDKKRKKWKKQRKKYGFDVRDTWNLDFTFKCFLYERLMLLRKTGAMIVDYTAPKFLYKDKEYNGLEMIDMLIESLRLDITLDDLDKQRQEAETKEKIDGIFDILKMISAMLWW